jgi:hypothetical protein
MIGKRTGLWSGPFIASGMAVREKGSVVVDKGSPLVPDAEGKSRWKQVQLR